MFRGDPFFKQQTVNLQNKSWRKWHDLAFSWFICTQNHFYPFITAVSFIRCRGLRRTKKNSPLSPPPPPPPPAPPIYVSKRADTNTQTRIYPTPVSLGMFLRQRTKTNAQRNTITPAKLFRCVSKVTEQKHTRNHFSPSPHPIPDLWPVSLDMSLRLTENRSKHTQNHFYPLSPTPLEAIFTRHISKTNLRTGTSIQNQPTHRNVRTAHNTQKQHATRNLSTEQTHRNISTAHNT